MEKRKVKKPFYKRGWFVVIIVLVVIGIVGGIIGGGSDEPVQTGGDTTATNAAAETTKAKEKAVSISANDLFDAYEDNEVKADEQYKGKTLQISGKIGDIGKDIIDESYITFEGKDPYAVFFVQCMFSDQEEVKNLSNLSKGDKVTITGECSGVTGNVIIRDCKIEE